MAYMIYSVSFNFGDVHPRISPGDKGFTCGISTVKLFAKSCRAAFTRE